MVRRNHAGLRTRAILAAASLLTCHSLLFAGSQLNSSAITFRFDPDTAGGTDLKTLDLSAPASSAMPAPPSYQFSKTFASGNSSSTAKGSIGYVANQTTASFTLAPGTGVTQSDPGNAVYKGDSLFRISFDGVFTATSPSFGPLATGYVSVAVGGVVGTGGSAHFTGQVNFLDTNNNQLRPTVNFDQAFTTAGSFAKTFTSSSGLNPITLATNTQFRVKGFFEFRASNHGRPSSITPLDVEAGSAPPTATWNVNANGVWANPNNWAPGQGDFVEDLGTNPIDEGGGETIFFSTNSINSNYNDGGYCFTPSIPTVPNGVGQRARFTSSVGGTHTITLANNVTLGALDFGNNGNLNFTSNNASFVLDTSNQGNASVEARNTGTSRTNKVNVPVVLKQDMDIDAEGNYIPGDTDHSPRSNLYFNKKISGNQAINKHGDGVAYFQALNTFSGGSDIGGGKLIAAVAGALGTGNVYVHKAQLNYNAKHAAGSNAYISVNDGGQIDFGTTPASDEEFNVFGLSAVSGSPETLSAINVEQEIPGFAENSMSTNNSSSQSNHHGNNNNNSPGATIFTGFGSMIGHESFDTGKRGNPKGLGNDPFYVFGISADFDKPSSARAITIGTDSDSPWIGFGSDRTERTFGSNPQYSADQIKVKGSGSLVSLNETLWLNAKLTSVGTNAELNKYGQGVVAIQSNRNDFRGAINVYEGGVLVNGRLPGVKNVDAWYGTSLGGNGYIGGPVNIHDGASLNPGSIEPKHLAGTLEVGNLTLDPASALNFDLDKPGFAGCDINDLLDVDGDLFLAGTLNVNDLGNFGSGVYTLIHWDGDLDGPGLSIGTMPSSSFSYALSVVGDNLKLTVTALPEALQPLATALVPEPGTASLLMIAAGAGLARRRRRN